MHISGNLLLAVLPRPILNLAPIALPAVTALGASLGRAFVASSGLFGAASISMNTANEVDARAQRKREADEVKRAKNRVKNPKAHFWSPYTSLASLELDKPRAKATMHPTGNGREVKLGSELVMELCILEGLP